MIIAVTGTPGTGKTEVAKELARMFGYTYLDLNKLAEEKKLIVGLDKKRGSKIVDTEGLKELFIPDKYVVDGHLSHYVQADVIVVLRTRPDLLRKRLLQRGWPDEKAGENMEAEILGVCSSEAFNTGERVLEVDTSDCTPKEAAKTIKDLIDNNKETEDIDWLNDYEHMLIR